MLEQQRGLARMITKALELRAVRCAKAAQRLPQQIAAYGPTSPLARASMRDRNPPEAVVCKNQDFRQISLPFCNQGVTFVVRYGRNSPRKTPYRLCPRQHLRPD